MYIFIWHKFTTLFGEEGSGSWLAVSELDCQFYLTGVEIWEELLYGQLRLRHRTPSLPSWQFPEIDSRFPQTHCWHWMSRDPYTVFCNRSGLIQGPTNLIALRCHPPNAFAGCHCLYGTYCAFASRCCLSQRGCTNSKPIRKCCSYQLIIVLLVPWSSDTWWLQWLHIVTKIDSCWMGVRLLSPQGCQEKEWLIVPWYCQSMRGCPLMLLVVRCWLSDEIGVHHYKLSVESRDGHFCFY